MRERIELWVPDELLLNEGGRRVKELILGDFKRDIPLIQEEDLVVTTVYRADVHQTVVVSRWVPATALIDGKREPTPRGADFEPEPRVSQARRGGPDTVLSAADEEPGT